MSIDSKGLARTATAAAMLAVLATSVLGARTAYAYALEGPKWNSLKVSFGYVIPGRNAAYSQAFRQAMIDWNQTSKFKYNGTQTSANPCATTGANGANFNTTACGQAFGSGTLAITFYNYTNANVMTHAGTVFNANVPFTIYSGALRANATDFRRVAVHELGHALGLDHENNSSLPAIMAPYVSNIETPRTDDIRGIRAMYGAP